MSTTTDNYNLIIPEGDDLFAPLNVEAPNFRSIDANMWDNKLASVQSATDVISGSVHAITRDTPDAPMFRYTATGGVNSGDTFTVDGIAVQAVLPNGMAIEAGAYITGCEVLAAVVGSKMTLYIGAGSGDADTLEGHPASYFATAQRAEDVAALAGAANITANAANDAAQDAADAVRELASTSVKIAVGFYDGTNTSGASNPNTLNFDFPPQLLYISQGREWNSAYPTVGDRWALLDIGCARQALETSGATYVSTKTIQYGNTSNALKVTSAGRTVTWYSEQSSDNQMNLAGSRYHYIAIG